MKRKKNTVIEKLSETEISSFKNPSENRQENHPAGTVVLAGAGCGSADLVTQEVMDLIRTAPVIFYDDLLDETILNQARTDQLIYVGKRKDHHSFSQDEINDLLFQAAGKYPWVLRLKGGDPFVFGRGMEEKEYLEQRNIDCRICSGITSAIAVPARAGIPVTDRRAASSFLVVTAAGKNPDTLFGEDISLLSSYQGTLVVLMGFSRLDEICKALIENGKPANTPAAVLSSPEISRTFSVISDLEHLPEKTKEAGLKTPAIIVIGETVRFGKELRKPDYNVGWCGTEQTLNKIRSMLPSSVLAVPVLQADLHRNSDDWLTEFQLWLLQAGSKKASGKNSWLVFVSARASEIFLETLRTHRTDLRRLGDIQIACIGENTAAPLMEAGLYPDFIPSRSTTRSLAEELKENLHPDDRIMVFRAEGADSEFEKILEEYHPERIDLYQTEYREKQSPARCQALLFGSPKAAESFARIWPDQYLDLPVFALSEKTGSVLENAGFEKVIISEKPDCLSLGRRAADFFLNRESDQ